MNSALKYLREKDSWYGFTVTKARQTHKDFLSLKLFLFVRDP